MTRTSSAFTEPAMSRTVTAAAMRLNRSVLVIIDSSSARRLRSGTRHVALVQRELLVHQVHLASVDEHVGDFGAHFQRIAFGHEKVGHLAWLQAPELAL